jgi:hypothetical protein
MQDILLTTVAWGITPTLITILAAYSLIAIPAGLLAWVTRALTDRAAAVLGISGLVAFLEAVILFAVATTWT